MLIACRNIENSEWSRIPSRYLASAFDYPLLKSFKYVNHINLKRNYVIILSYYQSNFARDSYKQNSWVHLMYQIFKIRYYLYTDIIEFFQIIEDNETIY